VWNVGQIAGILLVTHMPYCVMVAALVIMARRWRKRVETLADDMERGARECGADR
jgi:hypothetical protein